MEPDKTENDESGIERLERKLYTRQGIKDLWRERPRLRTRESRVKREWERNPKADESFLKASLRDAKKLSPTKVLLIAAVAFFAIATAIAALTFFGGANVVSPKNIGVTIAAPTTVEAGVAVPLQITITNSNTVALESVDLIVEYPPGTRSADDPSEEVLRHRETIGTLSPGESVQKIVRVIFFGAEDERKSVSAGIEYRVAGSNPTFFVDQIEELVIGSAPVRLRIDSIREANAGQDIEITLAVASNANTVLEDMLVRAEYPFGFRFRDASPEPTFDSSVWRLGDLAPESERSIRIRGTLDGVPGEERVFRFATGVEDELDEKRIGTELLSSVHGVTLREPFLNVGIVLDGERTSAHTAPSGESVRVDIEWENNLDVEIIDAQIEAVLGGSALDETSVSASKGFYRSSDNTVLWNQQTERDLESLGPGKRGQASFSFSSFGRASGRIQSLRNPEMTVDVSVRGRRVDERGVPEAIISTKQAVVRVDSDVSLVSRATHFAGPFQNSGPIPPRVERETTYTVTWSLTNTTNAVQDGVVRAVIPPYVRWIGVVSPSGEAVAYNALGGEVVWAVGSLAAGEGFSSTPKDVSFQVAFIPSISQLASAPELVGQTVFSGTDAFTSNVLREAVRPLTTRFSTDPQFVDGHEVVAP